MCSCTCGLLCGEKVWVCVEVSCVPTIISFSLSRTSDADAAKYEEPKGAFRTGTLQRLEGPRSIIADRSQLTCPPALMLFRHLFPIMNLPFQSPRSPGMLMWVYRSVYLSISNWVCPCRCLYHLVLRLLDESGQSSSLVTRRGRQMSRQKFTAALHHPAHVAKYLNR